MSLRVNVIVTFMLQSYYRTSANPKHTIVKICKKKP